LDNNIKCNTNLLIASKLGEALFTEFAKSYRKELSLPESDVTIFKDNLLLELHSITLEDMTQDDSIDDLALVLMPDDARVVSISPSYRRESQLVRSQGITPTQQFFLLASLYAGDYVYCRVITVIAPPSRGIVLFIWLL
jgi:hypothetical protein